MASPSVSSLGHLHTKELVSGPDEPLLTQILRYTEEQMNKIVVAHRETQNWSDYVALSMVRFLRGAMDMATWYKHDPEAAAGLIDPKTGKPKKTKSAMNERKWLVRALFLESVAGVPGMVAGMLRHLHSLRRMRRDNGW